MYIIILDIENVGREHQINKNNSYVRRLFKANYCDKSCKDKIAA